MVRDLYTIETLTNVRGGCGHVYMQKFLLPEEMLGHGTVFSKMTIPPGSSIGLHQHTGESEWYIVLSGSGDFLSGQGQKTPIKAGQIGLLDDLGRHGLENNGSEDLEIIALVLSHK